MNLEKIVKRKGVPIVHLSRILKLSPNTIRKIIKNPGQARHENLKALCEELGVNINDV